MPNYQLVLSRVVYTVINLSLRNHHKSDDRFYYHLQKIFYLIREPQVWTGESLILITPEDMLLAEERENNTRQVPNNTNVVLNWKRHKNAYHFKWYTVSSYIGCGEGIILPSAFPGPLSNYSLAWLQTWLGNLLWKFEFRVSMNMSRPNFVIYDYK